MVQVKREPNMSKYWIIIAGISGFAGVALGAFGAHGFRDSLSPEMLEIYKTGVFYQLIHSVVLLALALTAGSNFEFSKWFFFAGIVLFSFSLYLYAVTGVTFFSYFTPIGGVCFLIGWLSLAVTALRKKS
jgi:uncharacterized membrane protein YgdD (TMEM256/DUF423 family)